MHLQYLHIYQHNFSNAVHMNLSSKIDSNKLKKTKQTKKLTEDQRESKSWS